MMHQDVNGSCLTLVPFQIKYNPVCIELMKLTVVVEQSFPIHLRLSAGPGILPLLVRGITLLSLAYYASTRVAAYCRYWTLRALLCQVMDFHGNFVVTIIRGCVL